LGCGEFLGRELLEGCGREPLEHVVGGFDGRLPHFGGAALSGHGAQRGNRQRDRRSQQRACHAKFHDRKSAAKAASVHSSFSINATNGRYIPTTTNSTKPPNASTAAGTTNCNTT